LVVVGAGIGDEQWSITYLIADRSVAEVFVPILTQLPGPAAVPYSAAQTIAHDTPVELFKITPGGRVGVGVGEGVLVGITVGQLVLVEQTLSQGGPPFIFPLASLVSKSILTT